MKSPSYQEGDFTSSNPHDEESDSTPSHIADTYGPTISVSADAHMSVDCPLSIPVTKYGLLVLCLLEGSMLTPKLLIQASSHRFRGFVPVAKITGV